jgi:imidazolonepropionase-like amidohydrolase
MILVDGDPAKDIRDLRKIAFVIKDGKPTTPRRSKKRSAWCRPEGKR